MKEEIIKPEPDSQFRLVPCKCSGEPVYRHRVYDALKVDYWQAVCPACGRETSEYAVRHNAQIAWNTANKA